MPPPRKGQEAAFAMSRLNHDFQKFSGGPIQGSVTQPELPPFVHSPGRSAEQIGHGSSPNSTGVVPFVETISDMTGKQITSNRGHVLVKLDEKRCSPYASLVTARKLVRTGK